MTYHLIDTNGKTKPIVVNGQLKKLKEEWESLYVARQCDGFDLYLQVDLRDIAHND